MSREDMKANFRDFRATVKMQTEAVISKSQVMTQNISLNKT